MARTDIHRPSVIQPQNYDFIGIQIMIPPADYEWGSIDDSVEIQHHMKSTGGKFSSHNHGGTCHVCGAWANEMAVFYHKQTNEYIHTGRDCAERIQDGSSSDFNAVILRRRAAQRRSKAAAKTIEQLSELPDHVLEYCESIWEDAFGGRIKFGSFEKVALGSLVDELPMSQFDRNKCTQKLETVYSMLCKSVNCGYELTPKQLSYLEKLVDELVGLPKTLAEKAEADAQIESVPEGKIKVVGEIISIKEEEYEVSHYTTSITYKMLVVDDRGWKVYGTLPKKLLEAEKGDRVEFVATVTRSDNDRLFGIYSRPSKASFVNKEA